MFSPPGGPRNGNSLSVDLLTCFSPVVSSSLEGVSSRNSGPFVKFRFSLQRHLRILINRAKSRVFVATIIYLPIARN